MVKKNPRTGKKKVDTDNDSLDELKLKIKRQKDALTKIIKSYTHEKQTD